MKEAFGKLFGLSHISLAHLTEKERLLTLDRNLIVIDLRW